MRGICFMEHPWSTRGTSTFCLCRVVVEVLRYFAIPPYLLLLELSAQQCSRIVVGSFTPPAPQIEILKARMHTGNSFGNSVHVCSSTYAHWHRPIVKDSQLVTD
jgi:hypothetical protein